MRGLAGSSLYGEGIQQAKEALEIYERLGEAVRQASSLIALARLLYDDKQLDATSRAIELLPKKGDESRVCRSHRILGDIYNSKGEKEKAIHHYKASLGMASSYNWNHHLFWKHFSLALLYVDEGKLDDASSHIEHAKPYVIHDLSHLGRAISLQAKIWYQQQRQEEAMFEALQTLQGFFEKFEATGGL